MHDSALDSGRLEALERDFGTDELRSVVREFVEQVATWVRAFAEATKPGPEAVQLAHAIGSSAGMMGARGLMLAARSTEAALRRGEVAEVDPIFAAWQATLHELEQRFGPLPVP